MIHLPLTHSTSDRMKDYKDMPTTFLVRVPHFHCILIINSIIISLQRYHGRNYRPTCASTQRH